MKKLFSFDGRISRSAYWGLSVAIVVVFFIMSLLLSSESGGLVLLAAIGMILLVLISLATQVKRWHDRNKSGAWFFITFIPIVGPLWSLVELGFLAGTDENNQYGPPSSGSPFSD